MELITKLGIDWRLLVAQIVNFLILVFVLHRFAFRPLIRLLDARSEKIQKSLEEAEQIRKNLEESNKAREELLLRARGEAQNILTEVKKDAALLREQLIGEAKQEASRVLAAGRADLVQECETMKKDLQKEVVELVMDATKKVLAGTIDQKVNREYVNKILHP